MRRREFLGAVAGAAALGLLAEEKGQAMTATVQPETAKREYYELRRYTFAGKPQQERYETYLQNAWLPGAKRQGSGPVGVFVPADVKDVADPLTLTMLIPHATLDAFATLGARMEADADYKTAGAFLKDLPSSDPPYTRLESWLSRAFAGYPTLHVPHETAQGKGRTFELRTYESHSKKAAQKKIEMFNVGETDIFVRGGFQPVFFGENLIGSGLPSLTYMVTYADGTPRADYWNKFGADPEKTRLFAKPEYADKEIVSKIHAIMLRPAACSQI